MCDVLSWEILRPAIGPDLPIQIPGLQSQKPSLCWKGLLLVWNHEWISKRSVKEYKDNRPTFIEEKQDTHRRITKWKLLVNCTIFIVI